MTKLYFKTQNELVNFITEVAKNSKFITINNVTLYIENSIIKVHEKYLNIINIDNIPICCTICYMRIDRIKGINEYKIIMEENNK